MKATIEIPDELYRQVKAKSALEGRPVREVTEELYRRWLRGEDLGPESKYADGTEDSWLFADGEPTPTWFGALRHRARKVEKHDMGSIRASIAAGVARERDL